MKTFQWFTFIIPAVLKKSFSPRALRTLTSQCVVVDLASICCNAFCRVWVFLWTSVKSYLNLSSQENDLVWSRGDFLFYTAWDSWQIQSTPAPNYMNTNYFNDGDLLGNCNFSSQYATPEIQHFGRKKLLHWYQWCSPVNSQNYAR